MRRRSPTPTSTRSALLLFLAAVLVAHDGVFLPLVLGAGALVGRPPGAASAADPGPGRPADQPRARASSRRRSCSATAAAPDNPSALPLDYGRGLLVLLDDRLGRGARTGSADEPPPATPAAGRARRPARFGMGQATKAGTMTDLRLTGKGKYASYGRVGGCPPMPPALRVVPRCQFDLEIPDSAMTQAASPHDPQATRSPLRAHLPAPTPPPRGPVEAEQSGHVCGPYSSAVPRQPAGRPHDRPQDVPVPEIDLALASSRPAAVADQHDSAGSVRFLDSHRPADPPAGAYPLRWTTGANRKRDERTDG